MAEGILLVGPSGSGKSSSTENVENKFFINTIGKRLPYRNTLKSQKLENPPKTLTIEQITAGLSHKLEEDVSIVQTDDAKVIEATIRYIDKERPDIKSIFLEDWQYVAANDFMRKANVKGYEKFTVIARDMWAVANCISELERDDLIVYFITHSDDLTDAEGNRITKAKTIGKLMDDKITLEGMFTIVLYTGVELDKNKQPQYLIYTQSNGSNTCKSPRGMFEEPKIPNDLSVVDKTIREFYSIN